MSTILDANGVPFQYTPPEISRRGDETYTMMDSISISQVLASTQRPNRTRLEVYSHYAYMMDDPIINTAIGLHVTQSLGGHETTGDVVFLEKKADIKPAEEKIIDELQDFIIPEVNKIAYQVSFMGVGFGDAYVRLYTKEKQGVVNMEVSDFYLPQLVQPFESGGRTRYYQVAVEKDERLEPMTVADLARLKMPRLNFVPQTRVRLNHWVEDIRERDVTQKKPIPSAIGGSFLDPAERPFCLLQTALTGLASSRILDSIRESMLGLNVTNMTKEQRTQFINSIASILKTSKERAHKAIQENKPIIENNYHIIPTWNEKQLYSIDAGGSKNATSANAYNVDDVMFYAKLLAGSLGLDLSMLGFSEILSGGLGDGGFFRTSVQSAQRARLIRQAFTGLINHIIDVHMYIKYKGVFEEGARPYEVTFVGASSALERENQETRERKVNASMAVLQAMQQMKELGMDENTGALFLREQMGFDEDDAKEYAKMLKVDNSQDEPDEDGFGGGMGNKFKR